MKFVILFGPPAVGKMTVGHELARLTGFRLFHNHMTIDLVLPFFDFGTPPFCRLVSSFRQQIFEEVAASELAGLIFTYVWELDQQSDRDLVERYCDLFRKKNAEVYFVELEAEQSERLRRNESEFRLSQKPSKRDVEKSRERLLANDLQFKLNSQGDFFHQNNYLKIKNDDLSALDVAKQIADKFNFAMIG